MSAGTERRKGLRASVPAEFYFNVLGSPDEYTRGYTSVLKRLGGIDAIKPPPARTESQILLARIDQKLSLLVGLLAETSSRKSYTNQAAVVDISEYGLSFAHSQTIEHGTSIEIGLQLPMGENTRLMDIAGTIVHVKTPTEPGSGFKHIYGVEFFDIQGKDQNDIVQWIFSHQREQIRRRRERENG
ncbi:MAG: PilZ domain-containing protein [Candidatus Adiutrix sp.]|jgi:hypothetical protein|nr:PilZ domain-containing protein [Candidatus Adiutrix sp.]